MRRADVHTPSVPRYHLRDRRAVAGMRAFDGLLAAVAPRGVPAPPADPSRILVGCWAHLGDLLLAMPALAALRDRYPHARIDLLTNGAAGSLAETSGLVDRILRLDHWALDRSGRPLAARIARYVSQAPAMRRMLRAARYDVSLDLYGWFPTTAVLLHGCGIPVRIGFDSGGGGPLLTHPVNWPSPDVHVSQAPLALLRVLDAGHEWGPLAPCWPGPITMPSPGPSYVLVHTGTGEPSREWPEPHWLALLRALRDDGLPVRLAGAGARERERCARLAAAAPGVVDASGSDWAAFAGLVRDARLVVCLESLCAHVAAALGSPTVCLFGPTNDPSLWGPRNPQAVLLRPPGGAQDAALAVLPPDTVAAAVRTALAARASLTDPRPSPCPAPHSSQV